MHPFNPFSLSCIKSDRKYNRYPEKITINFFFNFIISVQNFEKNIFKFRQKGNFSVWNTKLKQISLGVINKEITFKLISTIERSHITNSVPPIVSKRTGNCIHKFQITLCVTQIILFILLTTFATIQEKTFRL